MEHRNAVRPIQSDHLAGMRSVRHGFFTREGGVSSGIYSGLNVGLGSDDEPARIHENRARVAAWLGRPDQPLSTPHQVHSPDAVTISEPLAESARPKADAVVTATPGVIIGVLTADCGPILFADEENGVVAAAHAGWKGAFGGVIENTIEAMIAAGARREAIRAVLGPSISQDSYEVGPEFQARFVEADAGHARFFSPSQREGHFLFDLPAYVVERLQKAGVDATWTGHCTYRDEGRFYSYRRTTHRNEPDYGRQISAIVLGD
ncbi:peptidoglycan editing factor PgeF [Oricola sp.]|uniref:peptidoglycan editing factor PgeF n=1 Tax=Oricola sp. TaxID=1979950 RepID=UPI0025D9AB5E|nr:peptidoglycan editing factor PgeF [Oricola sp.]MCI5074350.1 peptidoglycan editing factor PgeF [Oricola sp.]